MAEYKFQNFVSAKHFVDEVSELSEEHNHHPEIHFGWGYVVLELFTHDAGKLTGITVMSVQSVPDDPLSKAIRLALTRDDAKHRGKT